jgi:hypothetical protein
MGSGVKVRHEGVGSIGAHGLVLFDRKTRIAHDWAQQDHSKLATALKVLKRRGAAS